MNITQYIKHNDKLNCLDFFTVYHTIFTLKAESLLNDKAEHIGEINTSVAYEPKVNNKI